MKTHRFDPNLFIKCGINSCPERYTNYESFRSHVYRKHKEMVNPPKATDISEYHETDSDIIADNIVTDQSPDENQFLDDDDESVDDDDESVEQILNGSCTDDELKHSAAMFLLRTHEEHKVTQLALNGIVQGIQGYGVMQYNT